MQRLIFSLAALLLGLASATAFARTPEALGGLRMASLYGPACAAVAYRPIAAYQSPGGMRLGRLVLDHPEFAAEATPNCSFRAQVFLQPEGLNGLRIVNSIEVARSEPAMAVFEVRQSGDSVWYRGQMDSGSFWVKASDLPDSRTGYLSFEKDLVMGVLLVSETCDGAGHCQQAPQALQATIAQAGSERQDTCYSNAYEFAQSHPERVLLPDGRRAYVVHLAQSLVVKYHALLPARLVVPVYDFQERWTGFFSSARC